MPGKIRYGTRFWYSAHFSGPYFWAHSRSSKRWRTVKKLHRKFQELEQRLEAERKARHTLEDRVTDLEAQAAAQVEPSR